MHAYGSNLHARTVYVSDVLVVELCGWPAAGHCCDPELDMLAQPYPIRTSS